MSNQILEKLRQEQDLTIEEILIVLNYVVTSVREKLTKVPIGNLMKCNESDYFIGQMCERLNLAYFPLTTHELKEDRLFHKFGLIIFNSQTHPISYLIDLTYDQFKVEEYGNNSPIEYVSKEIAYNLIHEGYIPFTRENFENYIMAFKLASKNKESVNLLTSIYNDFSEFGIHFNYADEYAGNNNIKGMGRK